MLSQESWANDLYAVRQFMSDYLEDPERPPDKVYFTKQEVTYNRVCRALGRV